MGGKGELVNYTRHFKKGPLTKAKKDDLKKKINDIIDSASGSITVQAMVEPSLDEVKKQVKKLSEKELKKQSE